MGMDVYGNNPTSTSGEYFRNNVWWWRPLWDYCCQVGKEIIDDELADNGHCNDGSGLGAEDSKKLAQLLREEISSGRCAEFQARHYEYIANLPRQDCELCGTTGIRTDAVGVEHGMPERELAPEIQILTGRTHGYCNGCSGVGTKESFAASYPFTVDNVVEFVEFLEDCGGFAIC